MYTRFITRFYEFYYKEDERYADEFGWTALHYAAFLGHTDCVRILINEWSRCLMDIQAFDGSTALMVACANLPSSKECVKVLCEGKANKYKYTRDRHDTALLIAMQRKPDLEVVKWLVSGADMDKLIMDSSGKEYLMRVLWWYKFGKRVVKHPFEIVDCEEEDESLRPDETQLAEIAMYLADHGCFEGALIGLLHSSMTVKQTPQLLNEVVDYFLEKGAVMDAGATLEKEELEIMWKPCVLSLFAKKSLIYLEGIPTSHMLESPYFEPLANALTSTLLLGQASGILLLSAVEEIHNTLQSDYGNVPHITLLLETLYGMTKEPPSLRQLARTKIRAQMAVCGKFSRENLKILPLPKPMIDFVQLNDLGDGKKIEEIMESFDILYEDEEDEDEEGEQDDE